MTTKKRIKLCFDDKNNVTTCLQGEKDQSDCKHLIEGGTWKNCDKGECMQENLINTFLSEFIDAQIQ